MFLKPKHFIFECRPNFGSFCPLPGLLRAITFSAPKPPPPLQISAYATDLGYKTNLQAFSFHPQRFTQQCGVSATVPNEVVLLR